MSITPLAEIPPLDVEPRRPPDVSVFAALAGIEADLWAPGRLPGETLDQFHARRDAAEDILDTLLAELAAELAGTESTLIGGAV
jgi:hypothetical protein